jgi:hypothetical protein
MPVLTEIEKILMKALPKKEVGKKNMPYTFGGFPMILK